MLPRLLVLCVIQSLFIESICDIINPDVDFQVFTNCFKVSIPEMYEDSTGGTGKYEAFFFVGNVTRRNKETETFSGYTSPNPESTHQGPLNLNFPISLKKKDRINYEYIAVADSIGKGEKETYKVKRIIQHHGDCSDENSPTKTFNSMERYKTGDLIYKEYFDNDCISNKAKWTVEHKFPMEASSMSYQKQACKVDVTEKVLRIKPTLRNNTSPGQAYKDLDLSEGCTAVISRGDECVYERTMPLPTPPIIGGRVTTKKAFQYGRFEIKAKVPIGDWLCSDMSLVPHTDGTPSKDDFAGKIMMMIQGNENLKDDQGMVIGNKVLYTGLKNGTQNCHQQHNSFPKCLGEEYHTYEIYWSPNEIRFSVDGITKHHISTNDEALMQYTKHFNSMFLSISLGVEAAGGSFPMVTNKPWGTGDPHADGNLLKSSSKWYNTWSKHGEMLVKHIKVYAV